MAPGPRAPSSKVMTVVSRMALRGAPLSSSTAARPSGRSLALAIATTMREIAMNRPRKLVNRPQMAMIQAPQPRIGKPAVV